MDAIKSGLETVLGIFIAMTVWFLIMAYFRRKSGCKSDRDVLEFMTHGCAGCKGDGACHNKKAEEEHHELT